MSDKRSISEEVMFQLGLDGRVSVGQLKSILVGKKPACAKA